MPISNERFIASSLARALGLLIWLGAAAPCCAMDPANCLDLRACTHFKKKWYPTSAEARIAMPTATMTTSLGSIIATAPRMLEPMSTARRALIGLGRLKSVSTGKKDEG